MKPMDHAKHIQALDGLRGIACLLVVLSHEQNFGLLPHFGHQLGSVGVLIFFGLSGFLMAFLYADQPFNRANATAYCINRFSRIAPIYLAIVLAAFVIHHFDPHFIYDINNGNLLRHLLFSGSEDVLWSIPPEVQFYAFFLLLWLGIAALKADRWVPMLGVLLVVFMFLGIGHDVPGTTLPSKIQLFMAGAIAGFLRRQQHTVPAGWTLAVMQIATTALLCVAGFWPAFNPMGIAAGRFADPIYLDLRFSLIAAAVVYLYSFESPWTRVSTSTAILRRVGAWSFAMYLLHDPVLYWLTGWLVPLGVPTPALFIVAAIAIALVSWLAHTYFERPAQKFSKAVLHKLVSAFPAAAPDAAASPAALP